MVRAWRAADPAPGPAGELPGGIGRAPEHVRHLGERHGEQVVQDEREPLGRGERVEHDKQGQADRVREHRLVLRIAERGGRTGPRRPGRGAGPGGRLNRSRPGVAHGLLGSAPAGPEHVQRYPGDDRRQPAAEVVDRGDLGA